MMQTNLQLDLAFNYLENTGTNIFLTGKAGTGKTTFLKKLKDTSPKRMIVVAPTGVAAINAGGVTIHSFFQLPFGPYIPGSEMASGQNKSYSHKFSRDKINIIRSMDLLVIDESVWYVPICWTLSVICYVVTGIGINLWGRSIIIDRRFTTISPRSEGGRMEFVERTLRLSLLFLTVRLFPKVIIFASN